MKWYFIFFISCIAGFTGSLKAQQKHFIYLQTENKQPFYVKLENYILSSSITGYLIIPKLEQGSYTLFVGFPKKEWPEQKFECTLKNEDAGYLVKNFGDKGWGLFNLQSLNITMAAAQSQRPVDSTGNKTDEFSMLLSNAVNDPSILKKDIVQAPPAIPVIKDSVKTVAVESKQEPAALKQPEATKEELPPAQNSKLADEIKKIEESGTALETDRTYLVKTNAGTDTVSISIPFETQLALNDAATLKDTVAKVAAVPEKEVAIALKAADNKIDSSIAVKENPVLISSNITVDKTVEIDSSKLTAKEKFLPIDMLPSAVKMDSIADKKLAAETKSNEVTESVAVPQKSTVIVGNSDCVNNASEEDFLKLRKKMAAASTDDDMLAISKKAFKQRCFSTDQIKNLGVLFLKDEGRYNFFDQAYPHVWDSSNYKQLESQLPDPYFANRFKAMIRH